MMIFPRKIQNIKKNAEGIFYPCLVAAISAQKMWRQRCATSVECDASGAKFGASIELSKVETHRRISKIVQNPGNSQPRFFYRTLLSSYIRIKLFAFTKVIHSPQLPRSAPANPNPFQKPLFFSGKILGWFYLGHQETSRDQLMLFFFQGPGNGHFWLQGHETIEQGLRKQEKKWEQHNPGHLQKKVNPG